MCEFKIIRKNDGSQIMEDIVVVNYTDDHSLVLKDVLGMGEVLDSALILDVNTINQTLVVIEHPIIKQFLNLIKKLTDDHVNNEEIDSLIKKLNEIKT